MPHLNAILGIIAVVVVCCYNNNRQAIRIAQHYTVAYTSIIVTGSGKTGLIHTSTEIQFLSISERYTHALPRNTKYLAIDGQVCFYRRFFRCCKTTKVHVMAVGHINRTAWGYQTAHHDSLGLPYGLYVPVYVIY